MNQTLLRTYAFCTTTTSTALTTTADGCPRRHCLLRMPLALIIPGHPAELLGSSGRPDHFRLWVPRTTWFGWINIGAESFSTLPPATGTTPIYHEVYAAASILRPTTSTSEGDQYVPGGIKMNHHSLPPLFHRTNRPGWYWRIVSG